MDLKEMRRLVLNPSTPSPVLEKIAELNRSENHAYVIWARLSVHPRCPEQIREAILSRLFWRDLLMVVDCPTVPQRVKQKAAQLLKRRMERATDGEWKTFAKLCPPQLFPYVTKQDRQGLFPVLLENPRMTEPALIHLIHSPAMKREFSVQIVGHRLWQNRHSIQKALIFSKKTDLTTALISLKNMTGPELKEIAGTPSLHPLIRRSALALINRRDGRQ